MPAACAMSWEPKNRRWWKQFDHKRYAVSCRQLSKWAGRPVPSTKEGSYQIANAWWDAKVTEIIGQQPPHPHADEIAKLIRRRDWCRQHGQNDLARFYDQQARLLECYPSSPSLIASNRQFQRSLFRAASARYPERDFDELLADEAIWKDRFSRDLPEPVPNEITVGGLVDQWLKARERKVATGDLSAKGHDNTVDCLNHFKNWVGDHLAATVIDAKKWQAFWGFINQQVQDKVWSKDFARKVFSVARKFINWLIEMDTLPPLKNLRSRDYEFKNTARSVPTMTVPEVRALVDAATGQLKLHILLMANCGMTQKDISDLRKDEVEWAEGRIVRKRSKTKDEANVPIVNYKLWPITLDLLRQHQEPEGELVLRTRSGRPWVASEYSGGRLTSADSISTNYGHLKKKLAKKGVQVQSLKVFRKTSATIMNSHAVFRGLTSLFLGHAPSSVADRHYAGAPEKLFDEAVTWLGREYGFIGAQDPPDLAHGAGHR
jgi:integrase